MLVEFSWDYIIHYSLLPWLNHSLSWQILIPPTWLEQKSCEPLTLCVCLVSVICLASYKTALSNQLVSLPPVLLIEHVGFDSHLSKSGVVLFLLAIDSIAGCLSLPYKTFPELIQAVWGQFTSRKFYLLWKQFGVFLFQAEAYLCVIT